MYEPIIELYYQQQRAEVENEVWKQIMRVGVSVNKEELIRALNYDRDQYNAGYKDGVKDGRAAVMKEAIAKFMRLSQDHISRDRGEPDYHRGKAHAYSIAADMLKMWMEEET